MTAAPVVPPTLPLRVPAPAAFSSWGWDAADWQVIHPLLDAGQMPTLSRLIDGGVMGNLATLYPMVSPMLWNSIATGKIADKHGIHGFAEPDPAIGFRPVASVSRRTKALWNIFQQALGWRTNLVGWWASHPAEPLDGHVVSDYFLRTRRVASGQWEMPVHHGSSCRTLGGVRAPADDARRGDGRPGPALHPARSRD